MIKKILVFIIAVVVGVSAISAPVMAAEDVEESTSSGGALGSDKVNILTRCAEDEDGIQCLLQWAVDILSVGVGVLAFIGISVSGIQYLTAGGSEEKTRKAKRRMLEIVIGLMVYVMIFAIAQWLRVTENNSSSSSGTISANNASDSDASDEVDVNTGIGTKDYPTVTPTRKTNDEADTKGIDVNGTSANGRKVMQMAEEIAGRLEEAGDIYYEDNDYGIRNWNDIKTKKRTHCAQYVSVVLQEAGLIPENKIFCLGNGRVSDCNHLGENGDWDLESDESFESYNYKPGRSIADLVESKEMVPGDVVGKADGWHTMIYRGKKDGKYYFYSVGPQEENGELVPFTKDWIVWRVYDGDYKIGNLFHPK